MKDMGEGKAKLFSKIAAVAAAMTRIPKTGKHQQGYAFATDTDIVEAVRNEMAKVNMACIPSMVSWQQMPEEINNKQVMRTICEFEFTLACGDTGETFSSRWVSEALDYGDKGFNKVSTAAQKFFFLKIFQITTGKQEESERQPPQQQSRQQQPPPPSVDPSTGEILPPQQPKSNGYAPPTNLEFNWNKVIADADKYFKSASQERFNTCQKMKAEGAFANCKTVDEAAMALAARVKSHHEQAQPEIPI